MTIPIQPHSLAHLRIGYVPYHQSLQPPGDRRRFAFYAKQRGLSFEVAKPDEIYDLVVLSERADVSLWSRYPHGKIVFDLIDSYLSIPRTNIKGWLRGPAKYVAGQSRYLQIDYWGALSSMCRRADAVVCTTPKQQELIRKECANVHIVLDAHFEDVWQPKHDYCASRPFRIVWEGLPSTIGCLAEISPMLAEISRQHPIELHVITDPHYYHFLGSFNLRETWRLIRRIVPSELDVTLHPWSRNSLNQVVCASDLAVIPIPTRDAFAAGKPENKLLLFWRFGMPTLVSDTPAYTAAMQTAGVDMACDSDLSWRNKLLTCIESEEYRRVNGFKARQFVEEKYSMDAILSSWDAVFASVFTQ